MPRSGGTRPAPSPETSSRFSTYHTRSPRGANSPSPSPPTWEPNKNTWSFAMTKARMCCCAQVCPFHGEEWEMGLDVRGGKAPQLHCN